MHNPKLARLGELIVVFFVLPFIIAFFGNAKWLIALLWTIGILSFIHMRYSYHFYFRKDWNKDAANWQNMKPMLARFTLCAALITGFTYLHDPEKLFNLPLERPMLWLGIMVFYPVFSVIPQEFIYRTYFMRRYDALFPNKTHQIIVSAVAFGWMHIVLHNWIAIAFCMIGGFFFSHTYRKHQSLLLACIEHSLYGCFVFTVGLGWYFYHGRVM